MWNGNLVIYNGYVFPLWIYGSVSWSTSWNGAFWCADDPFDHWNGWNKNRMDLLDLPKSQVVRYFIYFISGIMDYNDHLTGYLLLLCEKTIVRKKDCTSINIK